MPTMTERDENHPSKAKTLECTLLQDMLALYGPMVSGNALWKALGYASADAFRHAVFRKTIPVHIFTIPNRRGKFALTQDIATWLALQRNSAERLGEGGGLTIFSSTSEELGP